MLRVLGVGGRYPPVGLFQYIRPLSSHIRPNGCTLEWIKVWNFDSGCDSGRQFHRPLSRMMNACCATHLLEPGRLRRNIIICLQGLPLGAGVQKDTSYFSRRLTLSPHLLLFKVEGGTEKRESKFSSHSSILSRKSQTFNTYMWLEFTYSS